MTAGLCSSTTCVVRERSHVQAWKALPFTAHAPICSFLTSRCLRSPREHALRPQTQSRVIFEIFVTKVFKQEDQEKTHGLQALHSTSRCNYLHLALEHAPSTLIHLLPLQQLHFISSLGSERDSSNIGYAPAEAGLSGKAHAWSSQEWAFDIAPTLLHPGRTGTVR